MVNNFDFFFSALYSAFGAVVYPIMITNSKVNEQAAKVSYHL